MVPLPDVRGREQILKVHMRKVPLGDNVKPQVIARGTPGFSGADLANLVNEAALLAARFNKRLVGMVDLEKAKDKLIMGAERRSMVMDEKEKKMKEIALVGNPNTGKTTIFNALTGLRHSTANYPGVTVEKRAGRMTLSRKEEKGPVSSLASYRPSRGYLEANRSSVLA